MLSRRRKITQGPGSSVEPSVPIDIDSLPAEEVLRLTYLLLLNREPDSEAIATHIPSLRSGERSRRQVVEWITSSIEWSVVNRRTELGPSLQESRKAFVRSLPRARRILDLGGTALHMPEGAMIGALGYPYEFDELVIVDLPSEDRHELYQDGSANEAIATSRGTVSYRYHSMTDLSGIPSNSFDLIYIGQAIEHVTTAEADEVLRETFRVLAELGTLALDTPNARVTRLQQTQFIDPDHKYEYTHAEMLEKLRTCGFAVIESKGLNYAGQSLKDGAFNIEEVANNSGIYAEIAECYLLSYLCRPVRNS